MKWIETKKQEPNPQIDGERILAYCETHDGYCAVVVIIYNALAEKWELSYQWELEASPFAFSHWMRLPLFPGMKEEL